MTFYLLFTGDNCYPLGGWEDYAGSHVTLEGAIIIAEALKKDWAHITHNHEIVWQLGDEPQLSKSSPSQS